jgi:hypothetical protein
MCSMGQLSFVLCICGSMCHGAIFCVLHIYVYANLCVCLAPVMSPTQSWWRNLSVCCSCQTDLCQHIELCSRVKAFT